MLSLNHSTKEKTMSELEMKERRDFIKKSMLCGTAAGCSLLLGKPERVAAAPIGGARDGEQEESERPRIKITVLKRMFNEELAKKYCQNEVTQCSAFEDGQEFIYEQSTGRPEGFCEWAWDDISRYVFALRFKGTFKGWMKEDGMLITCCTDGIRPVVFNLERI
jgi:uncharacterized repeat protein (TIGR04076 family)